MRRISSALVIVAMTLTAASSLAQGVGSVPLSGKLEVSGSSAMAQMVTAMAKLFAERHPGVEVNVKTSSSAGGIADAISGKSDIGMASRDLTESESSLFSIPIARDGVVFAVNISNPVNDLTKTQLHDILIGKIVNWKEVGGNNASIEVGPISDGHASREIVSQHLDIKSSMIKAAQTLDSTSEVLQFVWTHKNAISFVSTGGVERIGRNGTPVKQVKLDGILPGSGSISDGTWPLSRPFNLITSRVPTGLAKVFIEFALSHEIHDIVKQYDFTPYQ